MEPGSAACWTLPQGHVPSRSMLEETQDSLERLDTSWMDWEHLRILLETLWKWDKQPGLQGSCGPVQSCLEQVIQQFKGPDPGSAPPSPPDWAPLCTSRPHAAIARAETKVASNQ